MTVEVSWIHPSSPRPLCDVPWMGNSVVLADGSVNFCCFSSAVVGNVNQHSFEEIWRGNTMQRIRRALISQKLPAECQSTSCPIFRRDDTHYIRDRMEGSNSFRSTGTHDPHKEKRESLKHSAITIPPQSAGEPRAITIDFHNAGPAFYADLFVALTLPSGAVAFLPDYEPYAVPLQSGIEIRQHETPFILPLGEGKGHSGECTVCAGLFQPHTDPNLLSNCYWSASATFMLHS